MWSQNGGGQFKEVMYMAIEMKKLAPWNWFRHEESGAGKAMARHPGGYMDNPMLSIHQEVDRMFSDLIRGFALPAASLFGRGDNGLPSLSSRWLRPDIDIAATDKQYTITVEVPGVDENDITVEVADDSLIVRGEKKFETEQKDKEFYSVERSYGSFRRVLALPGDADTGNIDAGFKNGVLTLTLPRKAQAEKAGRRVQIRKAA
jgi:HSP20 family protein